MAAASSTFPPVSSARCLAPGSSWVLRKSCCCEQGLASGPAVGSHLSDPLGLRRARGIMRDLFVARCPRVQAALGRGQTRRCLSSLRAWRLETVLESKTPALRRRQCICSLCGILVTVVTPVWNSDCMPATSQALDMHHFLQSFRIDWGVGTIPVDRHRQYVGKARELAQGPSRRWLRPI